MKWKEHKKILMKDVHFAREYSALEPEYRIAADIIRLRLARGLTQADLARILHTRQSSIARLESGNSLPSLSMIVKTAQALNADVEINFKSRSDNR